MIEWNGRIKDGRWGRAERQITVSRESGDRGAEACSASRRILDSHAGGPMATHSCSLVKPGHTASEGDPKILKILSSWSMSSVPAKRETEPRFRPVGLQRSVR